MTVFVVVMEYEGEPKPVVCGVYSTLKSARTAIEHCIGYDSQAIEYENTCYCYHVKRETNNINFQIHPEVLDEEFISTEF